MCVKCIWTHTHTHTHTDLLLQQQSHPVTHLVSIDGGEGDVEEKSVENRFRNPLQRNRQQQNGDTDEDVCSQRRQPGLLHLDYTVDTHRWKHTHTHFDFWSTPNPARRHVCVVIKGYLSLTHVSYRCPPSTRCSTKASCRTWRVEWGKAACIQGKPRTDIRMLIRPDSIRSQW